MRAERRRRAAELKELQDHCDSTDERYCRLNVSFPTWPPAGCWRTSASSCLTSLSVASDVGINAEDMASSRRWAALLGRRMEAHAARALSNVVGLQSLKGWTASVTALRTHIVNPMSAPPFDR